MRQLTTYLIFCLFSTPLFTQKNYTLADTALANTLIREALILSENKEFGLVKSKSDSAFSILEQTFDKENSATFAMAMHLKGRVATSENKYNEAIEWHQKAFELQLKNPKKEPLYTAKGNQYIGLTYYSKRSYDTALVFYQKGLDLLIDCYGKRHSEVAKAHYYIGNVFNAKNEPENAFQNLQKALNIESELANEPNLNVATYLYGLGSYYFEIAQYDKCLECYKKALDIRLKLLMPNHSDIAASYISVGNISQFKGEDDKAIQYYQKGLDIYRQKKEPNIGIGVAINNIGTSYMGKGDFDKAIEFGQLALEVRMKDLPPNHPFIASSLSNLGNAYRYKGDFQKAVDYTQKALDMKLKTMKPNNPNLASTLHILGYSYSRLQQYDKAVEYLQKSASIQLKKEDKISSLAELVKIKINQKKYSEADSILNEMPAILNFTDIEHLEKVNSLTGLVRALSEKAHFEWLKYQNTQNVVHLNNAVAGYQKTISVINFQNNSFSTEGAKIELKNQQHFVFERAINTHILLSENNKKQAFDYNEQTKSGLLQAQIKESDALKFAGIPSDLLKKEYDLRVNITAREKQRQDKINAGKTLTDSSVLAISGKIFDLRQEYDALKQTLEKDYPDYFRLKYKLKTVDLAEIQGKMLSPQQTFLSYFVGDSAIFAFVVRPDTFAVFTILKDFSLESSIKKLRDGLYGYHTAAVKTEKLYDMKADSFAEAAFILHQKLLTPLSNLLTKEVIIVPDGILGYIPFDVLLAEKPKDATLFSSHSYFGKNHVISYNYSATLWQEMQDKKHKTEPEKSFIGFAPYFNGDTTLFSKLYSDDVTMRRGLDSLKYSGEEVFKAQKLMAGEAVLNQNATKQKFEENVGNYRIVHLATHGKANDKMGDYCFLAFSKPKDSLENELLYVQDIYNISLNADLVVLSACETGIGELKKGEGIVSLARAFAYAGAKSMVTTLWSVNDKSTMQIMENFYRQIKKGQTKDFALWKAKQLYLEKAKNDTAHPYFWSAFIPIGDMKALNK